MKNSIAIILLPVLGFLTSSNVSGQAYQINGNTLTTAEKVKIELGGLVRYGRPYKGGANFSTIFNEISLRASSEENRPQGISGSQAGRETRVKRFYERKIGGISKVYLIVGGGFLNQAVDVEAALAAGEIQVESSRTDPTTAVKGNASNPVLGVSPNPLRMPWSNGQSAVQTSSPTRDSVRVAVTHPSNQPSTKPSTDSLKSFLTTVPKRELKDSALSKAQPVSSVSVSSTSLTLAPAPAPTANSSGREAMSKTGPSAGSTASERPAGEAINDSNKIQVSQAPPALSVSPAIMTTPESPAVAGNDAAHSVSSLLTIHPVEPRNQASDGPVGDEKARPTVKGYDKFEKLKQLKELFDQNILTKEEFELEKKKILTN